MYKETPNSKAKDENPDRYLLKHKASMFCPYNPEEKAENKEEPKKKSITKKILTKLFGL